MCLALINTVGDVDSIQKIRILDKEWSVDSKDSSSRRSPRNTADMSVKFMCLLLVKFMMNLKYRNKILVVIVEILRLF